MTGRGAAAGAGQQGEQNREGMLNEKGAGRVGCQANRPTEGERNGYRGAESMSGGVQFRGVWVCAARGGGAHARGLLAEDHAHACKGDGRLPGEAQSSGAHCWLPEAAKPRLTTTFSRGEWAATVCCCFCSASSAAMDIMPARGEEGGEAGAVRLVCGTGASCRTDGGKTVWVLMAEACAGSLAWVGLGMPRQPAHLNPPGQLLEAAVSDTPTARRQAHQRQSRRPRLRRSSRTGR